MRTVEALVSEIVFTRVIAVVDDFGNLSRVEDVIQEMERTDLVLEEIIGDVEEE